MHLYICRDRDAHLATWLSHMHAILQRQQLDYQVFVVEQADKLPFNRAALMNVGFLETSKISNFSCFIFHDVDMVPETDRAIYKCPEHQAILHMAVAVSRWKYRLTYPRYCGELLPCPKIMFNRSKDSQMPSMVGEERMTTFTTA